MEQITTISDPAAEQYRSNRVAHWEALARTSKPRTPGGYYHDRLAEIYSHVISPNQRVLEIGCGEGDLLAAVKPSAGVGIDFSDAMLQRAREKYPHLRFVQGDAHHIALDEKFDAIILSDIVNDLWDVQRILEQLRPLCHPRTRLVMNFFSKVWEKPLNVARRAGLARPVLDQNWLAVEDMENLLHLAGFVRVRHWQEFLFPFHLPLISGLFNKFLVRFAPFKHLAMTNVMVARPEPQMAFDGDRELTVSVIVPARNEAGNVPAIFARIPEMGAGTEIVFVEGNSTDDTYVAIERELPNHPERKAMLLKQPGKGKGDAVRTGFAAATGEVLMILDADLTVPPEDLPRFYSALRTRKGEFINGVRLVYPMEKRSMQFLNLIANKLFGWAFSWLLGQPVRDTLCGTKVLSKADYEIIAANRNYFGDFDPFGDFDLLFGAAKQNLKIVDLPVRYRERTYGSTNISRFRHGLLLLRMVMFAARRIKFI
ncbi:MAG TPA: glycosyltransferase [Tepidisphaeraceae bacterium]